MPTTSLSSHGRLSEMAEPHSATPGRLPSFGPWLVRLFALTTFGSAALLFTIQPMFAKMVLPRLGGTPAVWNTCVVFFQAALLLGYLYAHVATRKLTVRTQALLHLIVLALPLAVLPIALRAEAPPTTGSPVWWLLGVLGISVGLPFFVLSTTAPLLQRWFSVLPHPFARDPYFLYAASNVGSMLGLLAYPFLIERRLRLAEQSAGWSVAYWLVAGFIGACALTLVRFAPRTLADNVTPIHPAHTVKKPGWCARLLWLALSFVPSSLMLGVTTHISTDVAAVPLLWVVPLALYLLTFILSFASRPPIPHLWMTRLLPFLATAVIAAVMFGVGGWMFVPLHLLTFFVAALVCHRELAERRPGVDDLTAFYLGVSIGGALGGAFNTLIAPFVFSTIAEYPIVLALAVLLRPLPGPGGRRQESSSSVPRLPLLVGVVVLTVWATGLVEGTFLRVAILFVGLMAAAPLGLTNRPAGVGLLVGSLVYATLQGTSRDRVVFAERSFFGVHQVLEDVPPTRHRLRHGSTFHGVQLLTARDGCEPTTYFHSSGPIGQVFQTLGPRASRVAVIGLGSGTMACYGLPGSRWTFYEIDPVVERIARDQELFTFLAHSPADVEVVLGDGRLTLGDAPLDTYDVIVMDAFSSDAVPMHLLTEEFVRLSLARTRRDGLLLFNISNRYLDLEPVLTATGERLGLSAYTQLDTQVTADQQAVGKTASRWLMMARDESIGRLADDRRWRPGRAGPASWTDDFSNIFDAVAWTPELAQGGERR